jgi:hypothetical protein
MDAPGRIMGEVTLSGTDPSGVIDCTRYQLAAIATPATITSTAITFQASLDGTTFVSLRAVDNTGAYSLPVAAEQFIPVDLRVFAGAQYIKMVPGSSEGSPRTVRYVLRPVG